MKRIDLHVHSTISDGTLTPTELVHLADKQGLASFALTDHDTIDGITEAKNEAQNLAKEHTSLEVISGVEISAGYKKRDIHLLGLLIDENNTSLIHSLNLAKKNREERNEKMAQSLAKTGMDISIEAILEDDPEAVITRAHFAKFMLKKGYVKSIKEAFTKYLSESSPYYVPREYISPEDAIALIKAAGGVPILAHPLLYHLPEKELFSLIIRLKEAGLMGLEAIYSCNINNEESYVRGLAHKYDLLISGGSDFHGSVKPDISLGAGRGNLNVPYWVLEKLKECKL
ncbi:PHP domain-containing protein [Velocimicrobium porci]|uniref:PHP domain-containing protein n=1 Tax=Velocimicrobium porci TaxID=2606634 RepID=A0A6L5Y1P7_9FIRM|nr:PHP domain-containing protein [Velocimicrobium porci]MSS64767.1 PHP domain-containing protein [Velocimicrobium porci]